VGKAEVVRSWKPALRELGFQYRDNMFQLAETREQWLQLAVSIQKSSRADAYKINPTILLQSPFTAAPTQSILVLANLRGDGIHLHVKADSWWPPETLPAALEALRRHALPWFRDVGQATFMAGRVEVSIQERKSLIDVLEPLTPDEENAIARAWPQAVRSDTRPSAATLRDASILHYLAGNGTLAVERTRQWLARLNPDDEAGQREAHAQLAALALPPSTRMM
jgi:hypothetical protein